MAQDVSCTIPEFLATLLVESLPTCLWPSGESCDPWPPQLSGATEIRGKNISHDLSLNNGSRITSSDANYRKSCFLHQVRRTVWKLLRHLPLLLRKNTSVEKNYIRMLSKINITNVERFLVINMTAEKLVCCPGATADLLHSHSDTSSYLLRKTWILFISHLFIIEGSQKLHIHILSILYFLLTKLGFFSFFASEQTSYLRKQFGFSGSWKLKEKFSL